MKKILFTIVLLIIILPMTVFAQAEGISIKSITLLEKSTTTTELAQPSHNGLELSFQVKFKNVNDFAKYKVIIQNESETEYEIETINNFNTSSFMSYHYSFEDGNQVVRANSDKVMFVEIKYATEVPAEQLSVSGTYQEDNVLSINVDTETTTTPDPEPTTDPEPKTEEPKKEEEVENPNTGANLPWIILISVLIIGLGIYLATQKKLPLKKISAFIIAVGISIPIIASAVEKLYVKVNTHVEIEVTTKEFTVSCTDETYTFTEHMTWEDFVDSPFNTGHWVIDEDDYYYASDEEEIETVIYVRDDYYIEINENDHIAERTYYCRRHHSYSSDEGYGDEGE